MILTVFCLCRLPRSLIGSPLRPGDDILEINAVPIVDQDQKEVNNNLLSEFQHLETERRIEGWEGRERE